MEDILLLVLGIMISVMEVVNITGNISTIHAYNRRRVTEENVPKYGKAMGTGTLIIGAALILGYFLQLAGCPEAVKPVLGAAVLAGLCFMLYAQLKYNKGIF